jgi:hypothetical protein
MIRSYGVKYCHDFPNPDVILQTLGNDIAVIKEIGTECEFILTKELHCWTQISELVNCSGNGVNFGRKC